MPITRRAVTAAALSMLTAPALAKSPRGTLVYVGTQGAEAGQGVVAARLDPRTGRLTPLGLAAETVRPTWLAAHPVKPLLYAVSEIGNDGKSQGEVRTFRADRATGKLIPAGIAASGGGGPTHLALDLPTATVLAANFGTGQVAALPILSDDTLAPVASVVADQGSGPNPRQKGPHAHGVVLDPTRRFVLVADLGADKVFVYRFDKTTRALTPAEPATEALPPGSGPRHLVFHPDGRFVFVLSELIPEIRVYGWNAGRLALVQTLSVAGADKAAVARGGEIAVSADGRFVYASARGEDVIVTYAVDGRSGRLTEIQRLASGGQSPWSFAIDTSGRWLLVAHQVSGTVTVLKRAPRTGKLALTDQSLAVAKATSIAYLAAQH